MAPSQSTPDSRAAFLHECISNDKAERDVFEELGLFKEQDGKGKEPIFPRHEIDELRSKINDIAQSFAKSRSGEPSTFKTDLANEKTFANEIQDLLKQYGQALWGKQVGFSRSWKARQKYPDDLDWDNIEHRKLIWFYIHCWIATLAVQDVFRTPRKQQTKRKPEVYDLTQDESPEDEISSSEDAIPHQAPVAVARMYTPVNKATNRQAPNAGSSKSNGHSRTTSLNTNAKANCPPPKRPSPVSPQKRKSLEIHGQINLGKLQKVSKEVRTPQFPFRPHRQQEDIYSVPSSTPSTSAFTSINTTDRQMQRETTCDSDATYRPRGTTTETETVIDSNEILADAIDLVIQPDSIKDVEMNNMDVDQPAARPFGTYGNPRTQDSVIPDTPNDTQTDPRVLLQEFRERGTLVMGNNNEPVHDAHVVHSDAMTLNSDIQKERPLRRQLFRLLLSCLTGINEFDEKSYDLNAEREIHRLLEQLWRDDQASLRIRLGSNYDRLDAAQRTWMNMRDRLIVLRGQTGYTGLPGEDWKEYLRGMDDPRARAQACIAFTAMKELEDEEPLLFTETFNEDLAQVFDSVTNLKGCNGADEFNAIEKYNGDLFQWIKEEESQE